MLKLASLQTELKATQHLKSSGQVLAVKGPVIQARIPFAGLGDICSIEKRGSKLIAQVVSFQEDIVSLAPFESMEGISPGAKVYNTSATLKVKVNNQLCGQVIDSLGQPLLLDTSLEQNQNDEVISNNINVLADPPNPLLRTEINQQLYTGVNAIDGFCPIGYGQRLGLFAGAGLGKSTLMGMIARNADVDITVIALVGERGREVKDFINESLGKEGLAKSVVVVATSNESAIRRMIAPMTATAIAEHFRDQGKRVLLLVDSLTRMARAVREVGLAAGELPVRQGYTSSVYTELPKLIERAGTNQKGSITAIYTLLTNGENDIDPLGEEAKSILDGHILLSNHVVNQGIRPAIDLINSISRLATNLASEEQLKKSALIIRILAKLKAEKDILLLGGTPDRTLKACLDLENEIKNLLNQRPHDKANQIKLHSRIEQIAQKYEMLTNQ